MALTTTNPNSRPIVTTETSAATGVSIAIDYTTYYDRIATALETIATNSTAIKNSLAAIDTDFDTLKTQLTTIADQSTTIATQATTLATQTTTIATQTTTLASQTTTSASKHTAMETYQKKLKELGEGTGIHVVGPYDYLGLINVYKSLIEQGNIADTQGNVSPSAQAAAEASVTEYLTKIQRIPQGF